MITADKKFRAYLKNKGLKFTPEREEILETVFSIHKHFDVEELYDILRGRSKNISRATIYRTLPLLIESHLIQETLHCTGNTKYEHVYGHEHHDHLVCIKCGNDLCEELENVCNCPEDCSGAENSDFSDVTAFCEEYLGTATAIGGICQENLSSLNVCELCDWNITA